MAQIRRTDIESLAKKLEGFTKDLPPQEQNVFNWLVTRAKAVSEGEISDDDLNSVSGGALSSQLAESLGFGPGTDTLTIVGTWRKKSEN